MALKRLPRFKCLPEEVGQHRTTTHLLPDEDVVVETLSQAFADSQEGRLPEFPAIECGCPFQPAGSTWEVQQSRYVDHLLSICDTFCAGPSRDTDRQLTTDPYVVDLMQQPPAALYPLQYQRGTSDLVADTHVLTPPEIERHFGISYGHIHHIDNTFGFADRFPYSTPVEGLYSCSAGCHPGGAVIGCAGHNAAARLGNACPSRTEEQGIKAG
eukprot:jgi/Botrbrau1/15042/Bobra.320_2s0014.1